MIISKRIGLRNYQCRICRGNSKSIRSRAHIRRNWEDSVVKTMNTQLHWWPQKYNWNLHSNIALHGRGPSFKKMEMTKKWRQWDFNGLPLCLSWYMDMTVSGFWREMSVFILIWNTWAWEARGTLEFSKLIRTPNRNYVIIKMNL